MFHKIEKDLVKCIENRVKTTNCGYIEAVIDACDSFGIEPELAAKYLSRPIKEKLRAEGEEINLLPKTPKLW